jgi:hypothetical protein
LRISLGDRTSLWRFFGSAHDGDYRQRINQSQEGIMKCIVKGCDNRAKFNGDVCPSCWVMLTTGTITGTGHNFLHDLHDEILTLAFMVEGLSTIAINAIDGEYTEPAKYGL